MTSPAFIQTEDLSRLYRTGTTELAALSQVTMAVSQGQCVGISGTSGSGKSTLMNLLGGLDTATGGRIHLAGQEVSALDRNALARFRRETVGMIFQSFNLIGSYSALENVMLPLLFANVTQEQRRQRAGALLDEVGLGERASHRPAELSGGEQQRVAIARALVNRPQVLLADEPTGNLDSHTSLQIMEHLARLNRERGLTVLMISHDESALRVFAEEIWTLTDGTITGHEQLRGDA